MRSGTTRAHAAYRGTSIARLLNSQGDNKPARRRPGEAQRDKRQAEATAELAAVLGKMK